MKKKMKTMGPLALSLLLILALVGCGSGDSREEQPAVSEKRDEALGTDAWAAASMLDSGTETRLRAELQSAINAIMTSPTEIVHSDVAIPGETYTGTAYYVSNDGDDSAVSSWTI